jgi:hypothetical protein
MALDQEVRAIGIDSNSGKVWPIADTGQPAVELHQIEVGSQEPGNNDNGGAVSARNTQAVIDRGCVKEENLRSTQRFRPWQKIAVGIGFGR